MLDKDLVLESLIINESMIHDMLVDYSQIPNFNQVYQKDITKLNRIRVLITDMGGTKLRTSTETF